MAVEAKAFPDRVFPEIELPSLGRVTRPLGQAVREVNKLFKGYTEKFDALFALSSEQTFRKRTGIGSLRMPMSLKMDVVREDTQNFWHIDQREWD